jgi:hypothetical protein
VTGAEGCNDVAVLLYDVDEDDTLEVIVPSSCNPKTFCFRGKTGNIHWQTPTAGSDSPPTIADLNADGVADILHGGFDGSIKSFNSKTGVQQWSKMVYANSWVQTAPTLVDLDGDGKLDIVAGTWAFSPDTSRMYAYRGSDQSLMWSRAMAKYIYHGTAVADIDNDGKPELVVGDYTGKLYVLNGENGSTVWEYQASVYIGAPATIADVNRDGNCDIIYCDAYGVGALSKTGVQMWYYNSPDYATSFRGVAVADINGDLYPDVVFGTSKGRVIALNGNNGSVIWNLDLAAHIGKTFDINHAPLIADFDQDGKIDVFIVGGSTEYPAFQNNYGRAYMITAGNGNGPDYLMFQHDERRRSSLCDAPLDVSDIDQQRVSLNLYPNPFSNQLHISTSHAGKFSIRGIDGHILRQGVLPQGDSELHITDMADGIYLLHLQTELGTRVEKIIKH